MPDPTETAGPLTVERFLSEVAVLMGLGPLDGAKLSGAQSFKGISDLPCRLRVQETPGGPQGRPEVLLSLAAEELSGRDVVRVFTLQSMLFTEGVWFLGMSPEGFLQLTALKWFDEPRDVVAALDVANALSLAVMRTILQIPAPEAPETNAGGRP